MRTEMRWPRAIDFARRIVLRATRSNVEEEEEVMWLRCSGAILITVWPKCCCCCCCYLRSALMLRLVQQNTTTKDEAFAGADYDLRTLI